MTFKLFAAALCCAAQTAWADIPEKLEAAFQGWVADVGADAAVMTIWQKGQFHRDVAIGMEANAPVELASLSKAVTALCAAHLIETGDWTAETTSLSVLGYGPDALSVGALMTHSAGLGPDDTQGQMPIWLDTQADRSADAAATALTRTPQTAKIGSYAYNNENYAILAAMISAQTGEPHTTYCKDNVLSAAGATTAMPSDRTASMAGWGGWKMSVQDYARLMHWAYGPEGRIGSAPQDWPQADMGGGAFYGVGMTQRAFQGSMNYRHFGALCFPGRMNVGTYAVSWMTEWRVVVFYDRCLPWEDMVRLDNVLAAAVLQ
ncbi:serine hydrolase [uncultured Sulfitobacter sp.]|uniref:serine hydrolase domain-containing protein n=1 Tax=uncultured Sulfitobacter sp. TaxID=191468 RepID=UPI00260FA5C4|nr:serine hydrolase domain-containing protein [uncultured Sulfitobacter sp.]